MRSIYLINLLFILGCSNNFNPSSDEQNDTSSSANLNVELKASVDSGPFQGAPVLNNVRNSRLEVQLPLGLNTFVPQLEFSTQNLNLSGRIQTDILGFKTLTVSLPYFALLRGVNLPPAESLPTGTPIGLYFAGKESVPLYSFNLDSSGLIRGYLYIDPPRFGLFLQTPFDLSSARTYPVNLDNSFMSIGSFSTHPHMAGQNGGVFLFISLPR
ncbi:MAG: hypothetical protein ACK5V3_01230 [Bdellovibrionales bacterium]